MEKRDRQQGLKTPILRCGGVARGRGASSPEADEARQQHCLKRGKATCSLGRADNLPESGI